MSCNIKNGETVYLHGKEFVVVNVNSLPRKVGGDVTEYLIDIASVYLNHHNNISVLRIDGISQYSVSKK